MGKAGNEVRACGRLHPLVVLAKFHRDLTSLLAENERSSLRREPRALPEHAVHCETRWRVTRGAGLFRFLRAQVLWMEDILLYAGWENSILS